MNTNCEYQIHGVCRIRQQDCHEDDKTKCYKWQDNNRWRYRMPDNTIKEGELVDMCEGVWESRK